jgi:hypothetical protein
MGIDDDKTTEHELAATEPEATEPESTEPEATGQVATPGALDRMLDAGVTLLDPTDL